MVRFWWDSVSQATAEELLVVVVLYWVFGVDSRMGQSDKGMLVERVLVGCVSVISLVGAMEVSR